MDLNIDFKNLKIEDIKEKLLKLADKKTLIKIGIGAGAVIIFLIIYYAVLNPMVNSRKAKLVDMNKKKTGNRAGAETERRPAGPQKQDTRKGTN